ncbi:MAG: glutamate racemase [Deltaproteobacteria bacterium]|nr:glutamate racemase [Deltaproteobacteria bacterium]
MGPETRAAPIGIFDSGLGGLTVVRAIRQALPHEDLVYLGDTARVPYGTRSAHTVLRYAQTCGEHLRQRGVKLLVVACNTVSAVALPMLRVELDIPVLGVVGPGARAGVAAAKGKRLGVLATPGTVASGAYSRAVAAEDPRVEVFAQAAPLLVPLAEEGWVSGQVPELVAARYLEPLFDAKVGALVLGCTHYPVLIDVIREQVARRCGPDVPVVDSAHALASELSELLRERELSNASTGPGRLRVLVTDRPSDFSAVARRFLGAELEESPVEAVDL